MSVELSKTSTATLESQCGRCHKTFDELLNENQSVVALPCGHVFDRDCFNTLAKMKSCLCKAHIEGFAPFAFLNHAVEIDYSKTCTLCNRTYEALCRDKQALMITNCGHLFDKACLERESLNAQQKGIALTCWCSKEIIVYDQYVYNGSINDKCVDCSTDLTRLTSFRDSILITNCGHAVDNTCFQLKKLVKPDESPKCTECKTKIRQVARYHFPPSELQAYRQGAERSSMPKRSAPISLPPRRTNPISGPSSAPAKVHWMQKENSFSRLSIPFAAQSMPFSKEEHYTKDEEPPEEYFSAPSSQNGSKTLDESDFELI